MAIGPEPHHSLADATDRINATLMAAGDPSRSEAERKASLTAWSKDVDGLPDVEDRILFAEAALTYAARLPVSTCELVKREAREKLADLKSLAPDKKEL